MNPETGGVSHAAPAGLPASAPLSPAPHKIGRYDLLRRLGAGGMAEVHLARASGLEGFEKLLVLKRILPHLAADANFVQMFLAEARLAALLQHTNIVQVFDLGKDNAHFFFTMEFVYGENAHAISKAARRRGQLLPIEHAITITIGAAAGLHYAHTRVGFDGKPLGIVHRDVSPTNIMVTYDGCPKVADFGIAKVTNRTDVTQAGIRKGKVPYMSPEQCKAKRVDRRSDVFALGICLYELSTQTRLFEGDNEFGVMNRIVTGDIPLPSSRRANYPPELERIVMKALDIDRDRRYASCQEMQRDLGTFVRNMRLDASALSLGAWMHRTFNPQPFPWGAIQGDGVKGVTRGAQPTLADGASGPTSRPGDPASQPDMTPISAMGSVPSSAASGLVPPSAAPVSRPQVTGPSQVHTGQGATAGNGTLKGVAMGLGVVAALAVATVGGMYVYAQSEARSEGGSEGGSEAGANGIAASVEGSAAAQERPSPAASMAAAAPTPAPVATLAAPPPTPEPEPEPDIEVIDEPEPEPAPKPKAKRATSSKPKASKSKASPKPKVKKTKKKKKSDPKLDGFWGG